MNKTAQNLAWNCLPLEVKKEVKRQYQIAINTKEYYTECTLEYLFGSHNLTSDVEGEEMLMCEKSRVQKIFAGQTEAQKSTPCGTILHHEAAAKAELLYTLFGSKCLPDEVAKESAKEPKPAEPKFKVGDIVRFKYCCTTYRIDGFKMSDGVMLYQVGEVWAEESDLEP